MIPSEFEASAVKLTQAGQHGLGMVTRPPTPRSAQAVMDHGVGRALHSAAADRVALGAEVGVTHAVLIGAEVVGRFLDQVRPAGLLQVELIQGTR
jgi:hypothetical protein